MANIVVSYLQDDRLTATVRGARSDDGPAPRARARTWPRAHGADRVRVGGLRRVHFYAERYLRRHSLGLTGLVIECGHDVSEDGPARVSDIRISVMAPGLPETRREPSLG